MEETEFQSRPRWSLPTKFTVSLMMLGLVVYLLLCHLYANLFDLDPFPIISSSPLPPPNPRWWQKNKVNPQVPDPLERGEKP